MAADANGWVLPFSAIGAADLSRVGGKGANLGELARAGLPVPDGFCVTTDAFRRALFRERDERFEALLDALAAVPAGDVAAARAAGEAIREHVRARPVPEEIRRAILAAWEQAGTAHAYAVRSSATAEDLPHASFAGQQDTYLNVAGAEELIARVRDCWASLYTDRAILYRIEQGIRHRDVALCVVVQRLVRSEKAGILFTAHPVSGHRNVSVIEAGWGLGESLVSGIVSPDRYEVERHNGRVIAAQRGDKTVAIRPRQGEGEGAGGGTETVSLGAAEQKEQVLDGRELRALCALGRDVEAHQGAPQDIEWAIAGGELYLLQARPITSLFPKVEGAREDEHLNVYLCFNHLQVMTDAMAPMALHVFQLLMPFDRAPGEEGESPWAGVAGGRLYVNVAKVMRSPLGRRVGTTFLGVADRLSQQAILSALTRPELQRGPAVPARALLSNFVPRFIDAALWALVRPTAGTTDRVAEWVEEQTAAARGELSGDRPLPERVRGARRLLSGFMLPMFARVPPMLIAGILSGHLLRALVGAPEEQLVRLGRGLSGNVTTEMDLAVGDLADCARAHPEVAARIAEGGATLEEIEALPGGAEFRRALDRFLDRYGFRGPSEIDLSRPRYRDAPGAILAVVAGNLRTGERGAHRAHHARLAGEAEAAAQAIVEAAARGPLGPARAAIARRLITAHRDLMPVREHPKMLLVRLLDALRRLALEAGAALAAEGRLEQAEDVFFLDLRELEAALTDPGLPLRERVAQRREELAYYQGLTPPRVMTSDGEVLTAEHAGGGAPEGALVGSPASAGVVEGRARVVLDPAKEVLEKGEILVAPFTDPGWTPLFVNAAGLVMEVGGMMTHGSVVAREYGIPAVVCVPGATKRIRTGQRIRVHGDGGYVEVLEG